MPGYAASCQTLLIGPSEQGLHRRPTNRSHDYKMDPSPTSQPPDEALEAARVKLIKARFVAAVREELKKERAEPEGEGCVTVIVVCVLIVLSLTIVLIPAVLWFYPRWRLMRRYKAMLREWLAFAERAEPVMGYPLMVNSMLRQPQNRQQATGLFLICFEAGQGGTFAFMADLAERVGEPDPQSISRNDFDFCARLMADTEFKPFRRRRLPDTLTEGANVYAVDLAVSPLLLGHGYISDELPLVPCMAEPGGEGRITQMPYWFVSEIQAPSEAHAREFTLMLAAMSKWIRMATDRPWP